MFSCIPPFRSQQYHLQVLCVYLFHELPETPRRRAAFEFARVLKPGGIMILADSCQLGDRPVKDRAKAKGTFGDFNGDLGFSASRRCCLSWGYKLSSAFRTLLSELHCNRLGGPFRGGRACVRPEAARLEHQGEFYAQCRGKTLVANRLPLQVLSFRKPPVYP